MFEKLWCIGTFALFNVVLVIVDIATDSVSAYYFFKSKEDYMWGCITVIPIFLPFFVRLAMFFASLLKNKNSAVRAVKRQNFMSLLWHLPFLHPVK